jgi:hydroxymethylbilane synthase
MTQAGKEFMNTLNIGTRGSQLALIQARWVERQIAAHFPELRIVTRVIKTSADRDTQTSIRSGSATGVFVREIEDALLASEIDLAVHSMKDLPTAISEHLAIGAIPARADARDALVGAPTVRRLDDLPHGAVIGTGSVRRQAQILAQRPDLVVKDIRGNVGTRLQKLEKGEYDAIILACAGLTRLGLEDRINRRFEFVEMLPAPGQGALAIEVRTDDPRVGGIIACLHEPDIAAAVLAERAFLRRLGGGCNSPIAVHARAAQGACRIEGLVATPDGTTILRDMVESPLAEATEAAAGLAGKLLSRGGAAILQKLR